MASNNYKMNQNQMLGYPINAAQNQMMRPIMNLSHQNDSMQCSEVMTINQTNGFIPNSNNQLSINSDLQNIERPPDKRQKLNDGQMMNTNNNNNNNLGLQGGNQMAGGMVDQNFQDKKNDNNFNNITTQKENEKKNQQNLLKEFDAMQFRYSNEEYSHQINKFCKRIASEKHAQEIACKFPLYKMIRSIIKKFLFNELELIFFGYVLEESKWKVDDIEVRKQAYFMNDFLNITEVKDLLDYKSVLLYLILMAYAVKFYLNDEQEMRVFNQHMHTIVKDFSSLFQYWSKIYGTTALKIIPKSLNRVYRNLSKRPNEQNKKLHEDYNALVDAIIQISPPYNNEKNGENAAASGPPQQDSGKNAKNASKNIGGISLPDSSQGTNLTKATMQFQQTQSELLSKIVEQKQEQQRKQQQQQQQNQAVQPLGNSIISKPIGGGVTGLDSLGSYQPPGFQQNTFLNQQQQKFTGNQGQQSQQQQPQSQQQQQHHGTGNRDFGDFSSDFNNNQSTGILQNDQSQLQKKDINFLSGFNSNANINDNMEFFSNMNVNPISNSNNNYNFNTSYASMGQYPSFLQNFNQPSGIQSSQAQLDPTKQGVSFTQGKAGQMQQGQTTPNLPGQSLNNQNFGLQSSGHFDTNNTNITSSNHPVGTNLGQSGVFNTSNIAFSNGFIGQGNNSFNSHQVGFNPLYNFQSQNNTANQPSFQGLLFQTQPQQKKN